MGTTTLDGRLRGDFELMMEWRESAGYATDTYRYMLSQFIGYVVERWPEGDALTAEMLDEWLACHRYDSVNTQAKFVSCLREFCKFTSFLGRGDLIPGEVYTLRREAYQPYLFTDPELAALFDAIDSQVGRGRGKRCLPELCCPCGRACSTAAVCGPRSPRRFCETTSTW